VASAPPLFFCHTPDRRTAIATPRATPEEIAALRVLVAAYQAAEIAVLGNQHYRMPDGRELTRASLNDIRAGKREALGELSRALGTSRGRARRGVPVSTGMRCR